ncbi:MAG: hypothetical protein JXX14_01290, partial [Deltaproteobacteria bacterium]|nr:hypothetical protein [Deltaproteobacteria bacterium]
MTKIWQLCQIDELFEVSKLCDITGIRQRQEKCYPRFRCHEEAKGRLEWRGILSSTARAVRDSSKSGRFLTTAVAFRALTKTLQVEKLIDGRNEMAFEMPSMGQEVKAHWCLLLKFFGFVSSVRCHVF